MSQCKMYPLDCNCEDCEEREMTEHAKLVELARQWLEDNDVRGNTRYSKHMADFALAQMERVRPYLAHKDDCDYPDIERCGCSCGLDSVCARFQLQRLNTEGEDGTPRR